MVCVCVLDQEICVAFIQIYSFTYGVCACWFCVFLCFCKKNQCLDIPVSFVHFYLLSECAGILTVVEDSQMFQSLERMGDLYSTLSTSK